MNTIAHEQGQHMKGSAPFDTAYLVELARAQWPNLPELATALAARTAAWPLGYGCFDMLGPNTEEWNRAALFLLDHPDGTIIVRLMRHPDAAPGHFVVGGVDQPSLATYDPVMDDDDDEDYDIDPFEDADQHPYATLRIVR